MRMLDEILAYNQQFVEKKQYEYFLTDKYPNKQVAILTCMDARLSTLLNAAMGLANGDAKIIKNAGALVSHPFGSIMRSLLVAVYDLNVSEVFVVGHDDCGAEALNAEAMMAKMKDRGISEDTFQTLAGAGIDLNAWLAPFENVEEAVRETVARIKSHPLMPKDIPVHGLAIRPDSGALRVIVCDACEI
ncbi:beta-class carbonic anhydrase [Peptococcus simiae]|uniref:carbonic anhydrase n=1 Tax=Peptococcus simiae TaxID=1643805 RepID=A0ABW9H0Y3_9FIRM